MITSSEHVWAIVQYLCLLTATLVTALSCSLLLIGGFEERWLGLGKLLSIILPDERRTVTVTEGTQKWPTISSITLSIVNWQHVRRVGQQFSIITTIYLPEWSSTMLTAKTWASFGCGKGFRHTAVSNTMQNHPFCNHTWQKTQAQIEQNDYISQ